jgi:hypothetical protein
MVTRPLALSTRHPPLDVYDTVWPPEAVAETVNAGSPHALVVTSFAKVTVVAPEDGGAGDDDAEADAGADADADAGADAGVNVDAAGARDGVPSVDAVVAP